MDVWDKKEKEKWLLGSHSLLTHSKKRYSTYLQRMKKKRIDEESDLTFEAEEREIDCVSDKMSATLPFADGNERTPTLKAAKDRTHLLSMKKGG